MDLNQTAFTLVQRLTGEEQPKETNRRSVAGRLGGMSGGIARAKALSPERRKAIALKAIQARWNKDGNSSDK